MAASALQHPAGPADPAHRRKFEDLLANTTAPWGDVIHLALPSIIHRRRLERETAAEASLTYMTTTQPLGPLYTPAFQIPEKFRAQFAPTMITDASGTLDETLARDLEAKRPLQRRADHGGACEAG